MNHIGRESLVATGSDGFAEVFVSAVRNPHHFYVQLVGTRSIELDRLVEEMTDYYFNDAIKKPALSKVIQSMRL
jgi:Tudor domain